jgi:hypothetical protein
MPHALTLADISTPRSTWWHDECGCGGQQVIDDVDKDTKDGWCKQQSNDNDKDKL